MNTGRNIKAMSIIHILLDTFRLRFSAFDSTCPMDFQPITERERERKKNKHRSTEKPRPTVRIFQTRWFAVKIE